jgi:3-oxoacyl-[acyl-carrier-protein] synthase II
MGRNRRIFVTGSGFVTALGAEPTVLWNATIASRRAQDVGVTEPFPEGLCGSALMCRAAAPNPQEIPGLKRPFPDRLTILAIAAADRALSSARLNPSFDVSPERAGVLMNTSFGPNLTVERYLKHLWMSGPREASAITFARSVANAALGEVARRHGLRGPSTLLMGSSLLAYAQDLLEAGQADALLCIGADALPNYVAWCYAQAGLLSRGLVLGEASAALVLETEHSASRRGSRPMAVLLGSEGRFCPDALHDVGAFTVETIVSSATGALNAANSSAGSCAGVILSDNGCSPLNANEGAALRYVGIGASATMVAPKRTVGEVFGATELLAAATAIEGLRVLTDAARAGGSVYLSNAAHIGGNFSSSVFGASA